MARDGNLVKDKKFLALTFVGAFIIFKIKEEFKNGKEIKQDINSL